MTTVKQLIIEAIDSQAAKGISKYGVPLEDGCPPTGDWKLEVIQELVDACSYLARKMIDQENDLRVLREYIGIDEYDQQVD